MRWAGIRPKARGSGLLAESGSGAVSKQQLRGLGPRITARKQNLIVASIHQEIEEMEQPLQNGQEDRPVGGGEAHQPAANNHHNHNCNHHHRRGQAR